MNFFEEYKSSYEQSPSWMPVPKTIRTFSTDEAMEKTLAGHLAGLNELGLKP